MKLCTGAIRCLLSVFAGLRIEHDAILVLAIEVSGVRANVANLDRKAIGSPNAMLIRSEAMYTAVRSVLSGMKRSLTIEGCFQFC